MEVGRNVPIAAALIVGLVFVARPTAARAEEVTWTTTNVHFDDDDVLVIQGHFTNEKDEAVDRINSFEPHVKLKRHDEWHEVASATFEDIELFIRPGRSVEHTFRIHRVEHRHFEAWKVWWRVAYHLHRHHHDEHHEHHNDW